MTSEMSGFLMASMLFMRYVLSKFRPFKIFVVCYHLTGNIVDNVVLMSSPKFQGLLLFLSLAATCSSDRLAGWPARVSFHT